MRQEPEDQEFHESQLQEALQYNFLDRLENLGSIESMAVAVVAEVQELKRTSPTVEELIGALELPHAAMLPSRELGAIGSEQEMERLAHVEHAQFLDDVETYTFCAICEVGWDIHL